MKKSYLLFVFLICFHPFINAQLMNWAPLTNHHFSLIEFSTNGVFYALSESNKKAYRSTNDGDDWEEILSVGVSLTAIKSKGDTIFIGCDNGKFFISNDLGNSFNLLKTFPSRINSIAYAELPDSSYLLLGTKSSGVYISSNFGSTWISINLLNKNIINVKIIGYKFFAGTYMGSLYISEDRGQTWNQKIISAANESINAIERAQSDSVIYLAAKDIYKSTDNGNTWTLSYSFNYGAGLNDIKYSSIENEIFAGDYSSKDGGITWQKVFPGWDVLSIAIKDSTTFILNFGTPSFNGLYKEDHNPYQGEYYFPLAVGNAWQYLGYSYSYNGISSSSSYSLMAINVLYDTLISDIKYYRINGSGFNNFFRYEDNKMYRYGVTGDVLWMDFNLKAGQTFQSGNITITVGDGYKDLFGHKRYYKSTEYSPVFWGREWKHYNDSVGYSYSYYTETGPMGSSYQRNSNIIQAKIKIGDSLFLYKANYVPTINIEAAFIKNDSMFTIGITANHPYDKSGSTPQGSIFFVDSVEIEYFFSKGSDSTKTFRKHLNHQPNSNFFIDNIYFPDSFYYNTYDLNYRFYSNDRGIIPTYAVNPETGYLVFHLDPTGVKSDGIKNISFKLYQNYPNPFNPTTTIQFAVGGTQHVSLKVYDVLGNEVALLVDEEKSPGNYSVEFNAGKLSSGVYIYRLAAGSKTISNKMIVLK